VLDVGCGTGAITREIDEAVAPGSEVLGIDVSAELIQRATAAASQPNVRFAVADFCQLATTDRYDVVTAARVLQWLSDPSAP
jgi:ubiquinone/menaquinone biosynthesis C-methylase UbiE